MSRRKVHFSVPLHQIEYLDQQWETASRLARDGSGWLRMGIDRQRFRDRIERTAEVLNRILVFEHRQQIYKKRFENLCETDYCSSETINQKKIVESSQETLPRPTNDKRHTKDEASKPGDSTNFCKRQQQNHQQEVKYTNRKSTKKKINRRRKRKGRRKKSRRK